MMGVRDHKKRVMRNEDYYYSFESKEIRTNESYAQSSKEFELIKKIDQLRVIP